MGKNEETNAILRNILEEMQGWADGDDEVLEELREIRSAINNLRSGSGRYPRDSGYAVDVNAVRQSQDKINEERRERVEEDSLDIPTSVVELLRVTPHQFVAPPRRPRRPGERRYYISFGGDQDCRLCHLKFRNPVHLIQMAQLPTED